MGTSQHTNLVLFDGVCNLCNGFVRFLLRHDRRGRLTFGSLQSESARRLLSRQAEAVAGRPAADPSTDTDPLTSIVYVRHGQYYTRSTAVLRILGDLGGGWRLFGILRLIPRPVRDAIYGWIARNRYRWAGKRERCMIPDPALETRFLDS